MMSNIREALKSVRSEYRNSCGKKIPGKYVVFESDDWGSIRQSSKQAWQYQMSKSSRTAQDPFFHYDALERDQDLERIFEVLGKYKDRKGNHPIFTADYAVANPDFQKISDSDFQQYNFEIFTETAKRYAGSGNLLPICHQGMKEGLWRPQLHCREHVQINRWMSALRARDPEITWAFVHQMISTANAIEERNHYAYMDAFNYRMQDAEKVRSIIQNAVRLFESLFGFKSQTFVASCYVWNSALENVLSQNEITCMQGSWYQWIPSEDEEGLFTKKLHHNGDRSNEELYLVRNCLFEHSLFGEDNCVENCLKQIETAFRWRQPAIICSHRVNYMGRMIQDNGDAGVALLDRLLQQILKLWPDVEFVSSDTLADIYAMEGK